MKFIKINSSKSMEEIFEAFQPYLESEKHDAFSLCDMLQGEFLSYRTGIHSYLNYETGRVKGYYETGEIDSGFRGSVGGLSRIKTWFSVSVRREKETTKLRGVIFFSPWFSLFMLLYTLLIFWLWVSDSIGIHGIAAILLLSLVIFVRYGSSLKEQRYIYDVISRVCE